MDQLSLTEKTKYDFIWEHLPNYRECSLGEELVCHFFHHFQKELKEGQQIADLGCGTGRVARQFLEKGLAVHLIDLSHKCLDPDIASLCPLLPERIQFTSSCLWEMAIAKSDWIYCCDVLEHLPPTKIDLSLKQITSSMKIGGFVSICLKPDLFGEAIGTSLHLTVKDADWWREQLSRYCTIEKEFPLFPETYLICALRV